MLCGLVILVRLPERAEISVAVNDFIYFLTAILFVRWWGVTICWPCDLYIYWCAPLGGTRGARSLVEQDGYYCY